MASCSNCGEDKITVDQIKKGSLECKDCLNEKIKKRSAEFRAKNDARHARKEALVRASKTSHEENYVGSCKGGCGKAVTGEYVCYACREKAKAKSFALKSGEIELWRGDVKDGDGRLMRQIVAVSADSIQPERMGWVWRDRIPDEAITWILGQPNNAKSLLTIEIAACATTGKAWPDGTENTMGAVDVLMLCFEDSLSKQVV